MSGSSTPSKPPSRRASGFIANLLRDMAQEIRDQASEQYRPIVVHDDEDDYGLVMPVRIASPLSRVSTAATERAFPPTVGPARVSEETQFTLSPSDSLVPVAADSELEPELDFELAFLGDFNLDSDEEEQQDPRGLERKIDSDSDSDSGDDSELESAGDDDNNESKAENENPGIQNEGIESEHESEPEDELIELEPVSEFEYDSEEEEEVQAQEEEDRSRDSDKEQEEENDLNDDKIERPSGGSPELVQVKPLVIDTTIAGRSSPFQGPTPWTSVFPRTPATSQLPSQINQIKDMALTKLTAEFMANDRLSELFFVKGSGSEYGLTQSEVMAMRPQLLKEMGLLASTKLETFYKCIDDWQAKKTSGDPPLLVATWTASDLLTAFLPNRCTIDDPDHDCKNPFWTDTCPSKESFKSLEDFLNLFATLFQNPRGLPFRERVELAKARAPCLNLVLAASCDAMDKAAELNQGSSHPQLDLGKYRDEHEWLIIMSTICTIWEQGGASTSIQTPLIGSSSDRSFGD